MIDSDFEELKRSQKEAHAVIVKWHEGIRAYLAKPKQTKRNPQKEIRTFRWLGKSPNSQLEELHKKLIQNGFISSETHIDLFKIAFAFYITLKPLSIKWIAKGKNNKYSKSSLFHLIDLLVQAGFLSKEETDNTANLYTKLKNTFADENGNPLKNLKQTNAQRSGKHPTGGEKLVEIVQSISK